MQDIRGRVGVIGVGYFNVTRESQQSSHRLGWQAASEAVTVAKAHLT